MPTLITMSRSCAPSARSTSRSSGSIVASATATFTTIGKKQRMNAVIVAVVSPMPNQTIRIGTIATFGMLLKATSSG